MRVWLVGFGTVGRWVAGALHAQAAQLASRYGADVTVAGIGNARDGFVYHPDGLDLGSVLAAAAGGRLRHVATLAFADPGGGGTVTARVRPEALPADDPLARVDGAANALVFQASPVGQVVITGPGAGPRLAGQGVLADIIAVARRRVGA